MSNGDFELRHWRPPSRPKSLVIPAHLHLDPLSSPPSPSTNGGYTSLSDLIASPTLHGAVNSPSAASVEIRIRNRLVKQAAYAYLQPTPSTTETSRRRRFRCSIRRVLQACFGFIGLFLRAIRIRKRR